MAAARRPLGSTTHIAVLDRDGWACSVTCSNGSCSGVVVPGTGRASEQHARRAGPEPARLSPPPARSPAAEHDGPDDRAPRRAARARARQRRIEPDPLGDPSDDHPRRRRRAARRRRRRGAPGPLRGRHRLRGARDRHDCARDSGAARSAASATATCSSAASRRSNATAPAASGAAATRAGAVRRSSWIR